MNNQEILNLLNPIIDDISNNKIRSANLYAFKTKKFKNSANQLLTLDYEFYDTKAPKTDSLKAIESVLKCFDYKYLKNAETDFQPYHISNPKKVIDYIMLSDLDFSKPEVLNGTDINLNPNSYKVETFLYKLQNEYQVASSKDDFHRLKYTTLQLITDDEKTLTIVNKAAPIFKSSKNNLYLFNFNDDSEISFTPIEHEMFKLPKWPHLIIIDNCCFMIELNIESLFGFEQYNKKERDEAVKLISSGIKFGNDDAIQLISKFANKGRNYTLFADFDNTYLNKIKDRDSDTLNLLSNIAKINLDNNGNPIISTDEEAIRFTAFICGAIKEDILTHKHEIANKTTAMP